VRIWLALLATLPLLAVGSGATASNSAPPRNGLIAVRGGEGITIVDPRTGAGTVLPKTEELAEPAWSPDATLLAVTSWADESLDSVYSMKPDGTDRRLILSNASSASWSPDGEQLVVVRATKDSTSLAIVNADGTGARLLDGTDDASSPRWSPDGKRIAFIDSNGLVALITPEGDVVSMPTKIEAAGVSWSPDSSKLTYDGYQGKEGTGQAVVVVLDLASGRETTLPGSQSGAETPTWSPEGDQIAFQSMSSTSAPSGCGSHIASELWVMNADGSNPRNAAPRIAAYGAASWARAVDSAPVLPPAPTATEKTTPPTPTATPEGSTTTPAAPARLAGKVTAKGAEAPTPPIGAIAVRGEDAIYFVEPDSAKAHKVPGTAEMSAPAWSPDARLLAVEKAEKGGGTSIYTIWPNGTHPQLVLPNASSPSWSADGDRIFAARSECTTACEPEDDDANVLYAVNLDGSNVQRVDFEEADVYDGRELAWPTDGSAIHFFDEESLEGAGSFDSSAAIWSPDGAQLVFVGSAGPTEEAGAGKTGLWIVSADGGRPHLLLSGASGRPSWVSS
jgi:Tol biopolymer transport system component